MAANFIQFNMNHSSGAQDLAFQYMSENGIDIGLFSEPWFISDNNPNWFRSTCKRAGIFCNNVETRKKCRMFASSECWSGVEFDNLLIVSCYLSPNMDMTKFKQTLGELSNLVGSNPNRVLICGDFNARSASWGCNSENRRGEILEAWCSELNLVVVNSGREPTCVRPQGTSVVDLMLASLWIAQRLVDWKVVDDAETLSDHMYLRFSLVNGPRLGNRSIRWPRWNMSTFDKDTFEEVIRFRLIGLDGVDRMKGEQRAKWISATIAMACDCAARRAYGRSSDRCRYWWNDEIAEARRICMQSKRRLTRARGKRNLVNVEELLTVYKDARRNLQGLIKKAKRNCWNELIESIEEDVWGLPYKLVMGKLGRSAPGLSEELDPNKLETLLTSLFPTGETHCPREVWKDANVPMDAGEISI